MNSGSLQSGLSDLTLIMPTYNRHDYALRGIEYWRKLGVVLHVVDGSDTPIDASLLMGVGDNVFYHHKPVGLYERLSYSLENINTPYCAFVCDDEFFLRPAILSAIRELDSDPSLVSCGGRAIGFWFERGEVLTLNEYQEHIGLSLESEEPRERVMRLFSSYAPASYYSIIRADVFKKSVSIFTQREFNAYAIGELQFELAVAWQGKVKVLESLYWLRSSENIPIRGTDLSLFTDKRVDDWWRNPSNRSEIDSFITVMARGLANHTYDYGYVGQSVREAMTHYISLLNGCCHRRYTFGRIFAGLKYKARKYLGFQESTRSGVPMMSMLDQFDPEVASEARKDLQEINDLLVAWYATRGVAGLDT